METKTNMQLGPCYPCLDPLSGMKNPAGDNAEAYMCTDPPSQGIQTHLGGMHELSLVGTGCRGILCGRDTGKGTLDSPSNSAWPTPTMMIDMGSLAAWEKVGEGGKTYMRDRKG